MEEELQHIKNKKRVPLQRYCRVTPDWLNTMKPGDCSLADNTPKRLLDKCVFTHPWLPDSADPFDEEGLGLINDLVIAKKRLYLYAAIVGLLVLIIVTLPLLCLFKILQSRSSEKVKVN